MEEKKFELLDGLMLERTSRDRAEIDREDAKSPRTSNEDSHLQALFPNQRRRSKIPLNNCVAVSEEINEIDDPEQQNPKNTSIDSDINNSSFDFTVSSFTDSLTYSSADHFRRDTNESSVSQLGKTDSVILPRNVSEFRLSDEFQFFVNNIFTQLDEDNDGHLSLEEVKNGLNVLGLKLNEEDETVMQFFKRIDHGLEQLLKEKEKGYGLEDENNTTVERLAEKIAKNCLILALNEADTCQKRSYAVCRDEFNQIIRQILKQDYAKKVFGRMVLPSIIVDNG